MKTLIQHIAESNALHQDVNIAEKLIVNKKYSTVKYHPTTWDELRQIIEERYKVSDPGTEQNPVDFNDIDVSGMTTFYNTEKYLGMFEKTEFEYIDISNWDVSKVEDMGYTFFSCQKLKSIGDISNWKVSRVKYMGNMFRGCENLTFVGDLSNWDVSHVDNMGYMFTNSAITNKPDWYKG